MLPTWCLSYECRDSRGSDACNGRNPDMDLENRVPASVIHVKL